jgi:TPP-dependent pyruvate/acetoin dehydrogenase alpha subunit
MTAITHATIREGGPYRALSIQGVDLETVRALYRFMHRLRACEEALMREYHPADEMRCPIHFCVGQEAVPAALSLLLTGEDYLFSHHRSHGYYLAKHAPMRALFGELYGRETGANGGKAGSQDLSMPAARVFGGAILAGAIGIAVGAAFGIQAQGQKLVSVTGFGEAATEEGIFWEAINYASVRKLPLVFVCENNRYSMFSPQLKRQPADDISRRVAAFGLKTHTLFGNDVILVHRALHEAVEAARHGEGPSFVETYTYRWNGHVGPEGDDNLGYRDAAEMEFWTSNCPLALLEQAMTETGLLTDETQAALRAEIDDEIQDAFRFAKRSPFPQSAGWNSLNYATETPLADRLLYEIEAQGFDQNQGYLVPGPY